MRPLLISLIALSFATAAPAEAANGALTLAVSTKKKVLVVRENGEETKRYTVAVGTKKNRTPHGTFNIRHIVWNPGWHPPNKVWARGKKPTPPGHPDNPMKVVKIFFQEPDYYIHGTADDDSLGEAASHGCIRMSESEVFELARYIQEHAGAGKPEAWYDKVMNGGRPASVMLPKGIKIVIGP
jgi:lipoprotein-anchoring transpeptidase ErfK/SrfK